MNQEQGYGEVRPRSVFSVVLGALVTVLVIALLSVGGYFGYVGYKNAQAGAQVFNWATQPVILPNGEKVALGDILAEIARNAAKSAAPAPQAPAVKR